MPPAPVTSAVQYAGVFNLGTDLSVQVIDNNTNSPIDLAGRLISFKADPKIKEVESEPIDNFGYNQVRQVWGGWTGTLTIDRAYGALDLLISQLEQEYHANAPQHYFTIYVSVNNSASANAGAGGTTSWGFYYCVIKLGTSGDWKKDAKVEVTLEFQSQYRSATGT